MSEITEISVPLSVTIIILLLFITMIIPFKLSLIVWSLFMIIAPQTVIAGFLSIYMLLTEKHNINIKISPVQISIKYDENKNKLLMMLDYVE